jgi:hypothetical protein
MVALAFLNPSSPGGAAAGNLDEHAQRGSDRDGWERTEKRDGVLG